MMPRGIRSTVRSRAARALGLVTALSLVAGCAAVLGLDETFGSDGEGGAGDAQSHDDASTRTDAASDASVLTDGAPDAGPPFDAAPGWQLDLSYGTNGWSVVVPEVGDHASAIAVDESGQLYLAAVDSLSQQAMARAGDAVSNTDGGAFALSGVAGALADVIPFAGAPAVLVTGTVYSFEGETSIYQAQFELVTFGDGGTPSVAVTPLSHALFDGTTGGTTAPTCVAQRLLTASGTDVTGLASCPTSGLAGFATLLDFPTQGDASTTFLTDPTNGLPPDTPLAAVASGADTWVVGCTGCNGEFIPPLPPAGGFALLAGDASVFASTLNVFDASVSQPTQLTDVASLDGGNALAVGASGTAFVLAILTADANDAGSHVQSMAQLYAPDASTALVVGSGSHVRAVSTRNGGRLVVGALADAGALAVAGFDDTATFNTAFAASGNSIPFPGASSVWVGGAVTVPAASSSSDDYVYVLVVADVPGPGATPASELAIARLLHHVTP